MTLPKRLAFLIGSIPLLVTAPRGLADELGSAVYVRSDSDSTTVISPRVRARAKLTPSLDAEASYTVDIWTSASVDIRSAATPVVVEQRDEVNVGLENAVGDDGTLAGAYRYSIEHDYRSHGGTLTYTHELADNNTALGLRLLAATDAIGRAGDPGFDETLNTYGVRATYYQVLTRAAWAQLIYELQQLDGYQASPYRNVGFGGSGFGCQGSSLCLPESVPNTRSRHAFAVEGQHAIGDFFSLGGSYRYYVDDWGLDSHTVETRLAWTPSRGTLLALRHRIYAQSGADFYQPVYDSVPEGGLFSRDRELSKLQANRLGIDGHRDIRIGKGLMLRPGASAGVISYRYPDFVGLNVVHAYEVTLALGVAHQ